MPRRCAFHRRGAIATIGLALCLGGIPLSRPSAQTAAASDTQPIQIQADSGIEWQQDARLYIARGNAVAIRGPSEVHADTLIAHYREAKGGNTGGNTEIYRVEAEGHVKLTRGAQIVVGDRAVEDVDRAITVVTGKGLKMTTPTDVVTARDSLEWYDQKQVAVARGNAVAIRNGKTIKGDVLTAYFVKTVPEPATGGARAARPVSRPEAVPAKPPVTPAASPGASPGATTEDSKISRVDAQGHVVITNALDTGRGDFGVYKADTGIATLIGNVVIERGKDVIRGQRGVMDLNNNISRIMTGGAPGVAHQRVQGLFVRQQTAAGSAATGAAPTAQPAASGDKGR
ncbi:MAG TPA: LptA/OstA family protein [Stellaceae bacterium]|nr:LptA/OstA family protein [Stellaceae bacterium]